MTDYDCIEWLLEPGDVYLSHDIDSYSLAYYVRYRPRDAPKADFYSSAYNDLHAREKAFSARDVRRARLFLERGGIGPVNVDGDGREVP